mmetsp:Transcript_86941/g.270313  ORF Transcript_86941/g.270313 Transcript_86941/m.270313 type:complete len:205 (+) Transcript_86941:992-1606(+)
MQGLHDRSSIPRIRYEFFWREMAGKGKISFEEFLIWYRSSFQKEPAMPDGIRKLPYKFPRSKRRESMLEMAARAKEAVMLGAALEAGAGPRVAAPSPAEGRQAISSPRAESPAKGSLWRSLSHIPEEPAEDHAGTGARALAKRLTDQWEEERAPWGAGSSASSARASSPSTEAEAERRGDAVVSKHHMPSMLLGPVDRPSPEEL